MKKQATTEVEAPEDRISHLPHHILHRILSLLSQRDAVKTCLLSQSWRYLGPTLPKVEFRQSHGVTGRDKKVFLSALDRVLGLYRDRDVRVQELVVWMSTADRQSVSLLEIWVPLLMTDMGVVTFDLSFTSPVSACFDMPSVVFESVSLRSLSLRKCRLTTSPTMRLKRLQTLSLDGVIVPEETLERIISGCPLIENVSLVGCSGFRTIQANNKPIHALEHFNFVSWHKGKEHNGLVRVEIEDVSTIRTIKMTGCWLPHRELCFPNLTHLFLNRVRLCSEPFDVFSCNLPCLQEMHLSDCYAIGEFNLSSHSVKKLSIGNMHRSFKATIDAPSIVSFHYDGVIPRSISFATTFNEWKSDIILTSCSKIDSDALLWSHKLNELLKALSQSEVSLVLTEHERIENWDSANGGVFDKPVAVEHLKLRSCGYLRLSFPAFLNSLFRICRPRYVGICVHANATTKWENENNRLVDFLHKILLKTEQSYFWQSDLEEATMEVSDRNVLFRLKWKEL